MNIFTTIASYWINAHVSSERSQLDAGVCCLAEDTQQLWSIYSVSNNPINSAVPEKHFFCLSLPLYQRAQEEVHSKELKVKLLTDSVNSFIAKAPPTAHDALRSELDVLTANYQRLCSRLDGKCKTLEVGTLCVSLFCLLCDHWAVLIGRCVHFWEKTKCTWSFLEGVRVCVCAQGKNTLTCCVKAKAVVLAYISASSGRHVVYVVDECFQRVCIIDEPRWSEFSQAAPFQPFFSLFGC